MNKTVVVTGGTRGIGGAVSRVLFDAGWHVIAATVSPQEIEAFDGPSEIDLRLLDVTDNNAVESFFNSVEQLDGLVNCAGILQRGAEYDLEVFQKVIDVNLTGHNAMLCCCEAASFPKQWCNSKLGFDAEHVRWSNCARLFSVKRWSCAVD